MSKRMEKRRWMIVNSTMPMIATANPLEQRSNRNRQDQAQHDFRSAGQKMFIDCGYFHTSYRLNFYSHVRNPVNSRNRVSTNASTYTETFPAMMHFLPMGVFQR